MHLHFIFFTFIFFITNFFYFQINCMYVIVLARDFMSIWPFTFLGLNPDTHNVICSLHGNSNRLWIFNEAANSGLKLLDIIQNCHKFLFYHQVNSREHSFLWIFSKKRPLVLDFVFLQIVLITPLLLVISPENFPNLLLLDLFFLMWR